MNTIYCETLEELIEVITMLTKKGYTFEAKTNDLTVKLLGGY